MNGPFLISRSQGDIHGGDTENCALWLSTRGTAFWDKKCCFSNYLPVGCPPTLSPHSPGLRDLDVINTHGLGRQPYLHPGSVVFHPVLF